MLSSSPSSPSLSSTILGSHGNGNGTGTSMNMGTRTSPMVMARNMTAARAPRYAMYFIAAALTLLITILAVNPSGFLSSPRSLRYQLRDDSNGSGRDRKLQSDSSSYQPNNHNNNGMATNIDTNTNTNTHMVTNNDNDNKVTPMSSTEELLTREFEALGVHARACERLSSAVARLRRRDRVRESLAPLDSSRHTSNARQSGIEKQMARILNDRYDASEQACSNLRVQVGSLMTLIISYRNSNKQDMNTLREILNRIESLKTWREEQFHGLIMTIDTNTNSEHDTIDKAHNHGHADDDGMNEEEKERRVETGAIGDSLVDDALPDIDSQHWLDDAPDPDFRLPPVPEPTPEEVAFAREAATKVAAAEARARAAQAEEAKRASALATTIAQRAAGLVTVNLTGEEEVRWADCKRLAETYRIIPRVQWGTATQAIQSEYKRRKCDDLLSLRPVYVEPTAVVTPPPPPPLASHQLKLWSDCSWIHGAYDMTFGSSWGFAGRELQRTWKSMGCDTVMKSKAPPPWTDPFWQTHGVTSGTTRLRADADPQSLHAIAILVPTTTRGLNDIQSMKHLSLFSVLLPSIRRTVESGFDYHIWIGHDSDDAYFSQTNATAEITGWCNAQMTWLSNHARGIKIFVRVVSLTNNTYRKPGHAVNELAMMAYNDPTAKYQYFYRVSDDVQLIDRWVKPFVDTIDSFGPPIYGVVGPRCDESQENSTTILQDFVHRNHVSIFSPHYYPYILSDWWNDNWISRVYGRMRTKRLMDVRVRHRYHSHGTRYQIDLRHEAFLEPEIVTGRNRIATYINQPLTIPTTSTNNGDILARYQHDLFNFTVANG